MLSDQRSSLDLQIFHQPPDPNVPLPQPQSRPGSRRSRAICLSTGPRKPRSLYTPTLCLADAESEYRSSDCHRGPSHHNVPKTRWWPLISIRHLHTLFHHISVRVTSYWLFFKARITLSNECYLLFFQAVNNHNYLLIQQVLMRAVCASSLVPA